MLGSPTASIATRRSHRSPGGGGGGSKAAAKAGFVNEQLRAVDPDELEIKRAKKHIEDMQVRRQKLAVELERKNQAMASRDEEARERYAELTKDEVSDEDAARVAQTALFAEQRTRLESEEESLRGLLIEEDGLERKLLVNSDHLTLIGIAVSRLYSESRRRQWEEEARAEGTRNKERMDARARESFLASHEDSRRSVVRDEQNRYKSILADHHTKIGQARKRGEERQVQDEIDQRRREEEAAAAAEQAAEDEVAAMERALEERANAIAGKFNEAMVRPRNVPGPPVIITPRLLDSGDDDDDDAGDMALETETACVDGVIDFRGPSTLSRASTTATNHPAGSSPGNAPLSPMPGIATTNSYRRGDGCSSSQATYSRPPTAGGITAVPTAVPTPAGLGEAGDAHMEARRELMLGAEAFHRPRDIDFS